MAGWAQPNQSAILLRRIMIPFYDISRIREVAPPHGPQIPGRFMTAEELRLTFGSNWRSSVFWNSEGAMDFLLGRDVTLLMDKNYPTQPKAVFLDTTGWDHSSHGWAISESALIVLGPDAGSGGGLAYTPSPPPPTNRRRLLR